MSVRVTKAACARGLAAVWLAVSVVAVTAQETNELVRIDFRNKIPGVVDAPVFKLDGITRLEGLVYISQLYAGAATDSLAPIGYSFSFLTGADAGYWAYDTPIEVVPFFLPTLGQEIYYSVVIFEYLNRGPFPEAVEVGRSKVYSMVITNTVMPLVGFESFKLEPERLEIRAQGDQVIIQWQYLAASRYELQSTTSLQPPNFWTPIFEWSFDWADLDQRRHLFSVTNTVAALQQFYRLERWAPSRE